MSSSNKQQQQDLEKEEKEREEKERSLYKNLKPILEEKNIPLVTFTQGGEEYRKKVLGEEYAEIRSKAQWIYDQPIKMFAEEDKEKAASQASKTGTGTTNTTQQQATTTSTTSKR